MSQIRFDLLVVDDDDLVPAGLRLVLPQPWKMTHINSPRDVNDRTAWAAAMVDIHLTGNLGRTEGIDVIAELRRLDPHLEIVAMSGDLDRDLMEACLKAGASRFLAKPLNPDELILTLEKIEALQLLREAATRTQLASVNWIGSGKASQTVKRAIASLRGEPGPILIEGESGTGKEVAAALIHAQEGDNRPFVSVNLGAVPDSVFESEMFGHVRGAFTGADTNKMGLCEAAHNGDLFLDEVEALPLGQQAKLLRFLETGEVRRVGAKESARFKARVIAATNRNLEALVKEGKFREDLLWRLNGRKLTLPPLRERLEDLKELAEYFLKLDRPKRNKSIADDAIEMLKSHHWPGNVRELKRVVEQMSLQGPLPVLRAEDARRVLPMTTSSSLGSHLDLSRGIQALLADFEAMIIRQTLDKQPDIDQAAALIGISRSSLYKKIKDYGIEI